MRPIHPELRRAIVKWLFDNEHEFQRCNACTEKFRQYIYDVDGQFIIGGEDVLNFIRQMNDILFR